MVLMILKEDGLLIMFVFQARVDLLLCNPGAEASRPDLWARAISHNEDDTVRLDTVLLCFTFALCSGARCSSYCEEAAEGPHRDLRG